MKPTCLSLAFAVFLAIPALAQSTDSTNQPAATPPPPATPPPAHPAPPSRPPPLTKEESAEVAKAYAAAIKTDPGLATEQTGLQDKMKALQAQQKDLDEKILAAMNSADPDLAPVVAAHPGGVHPPRPAPAPKKDTKPAPKPAPKPADKPKTEKKSKATPSTNAPTATPPVTN